MSEPSPLQTDPLQTLVERQFPGAQIIRDGDKVMLVTVHAIGESEQAVYESALADYNRMRTNGACVNQMLDEIAAEFATRGMSRERFNNINESLDMVETAISDGILTKVIQPILVPSMNRKVEELRRRAAMRLGMVAQEMANYNAAKEHAAKPVAPLAPPMTFDELVASLKH